MKEIIMFAGNIGSGKAYMMNKKVQELKETGNSIYLVSFADPIKTFVKDFIGLDKNGKGSLRDNNNINFNCCMELFHDKFKAYFRTIPNIECFRHKFNDALGMIFSEASDHNSILKGIRSLLQLIGTEIGQSCNKEIWPDIASHKIKNIEDKVDYVIIDDFRFLFEYYNIKRFFPDIKLSPYYVTADNEVRAKRRNITVEELLKQEEHISEQESKLVMLPWMNLHFPNNIINNDGN